MLIRPKTKETDPDLENLHVGDLEVTEEGVHETGAEPPSQAGAAVAVVLAMFYLLRAFEFAAIYGYTLHFASQPGRVLDLRWVVAAYCVLATGLLLIAPRFTAWFAPGNGWRVGRLALVSLGFYLFSLSVQPLMLLAIGLPPSGRANNVFATFMDPDQATYAPAVLGLAILLIMGVAMRMAVSHPEPEE